MTLLISDANILIDLQDGGLIAQLFQIQRRIGTPDLLFESELRHQHEDLLQLGLELVPLNAGSVQQIVELAVQYRKPSRMDLAALVAAKQEKCDLLTGDRSLRLAAVAEGVQVHGTLWVTEQMVNLSVVDTEELRTAYAFMRSAGRRLPWGDIERQLSRLKSQT